MSRAPLWRALAALAVIATSLLLALTMAPRLGLDLRGGTQLVFETRDSPTVKADSEAADRALDVLRRRADALGVVDPTLVRSGENRIIVELPGVLDPREAAKVIGKTAQLNFHPVLGAAEADDKDAVADESGQKLKLGPVAISGADVTDAAAGTDPQMGLGWFVTIDFKEADPWRELTGKAACEPVGDPKRRVAIVLDNEIISSPQVNDTVGCNVGISGGTTQISGSFTAEEAQNLAVLIKGGSLPVPLELVEQRTVGPTLGAEAIEASAKAGLLGVLLTAVFIGVIYRLVGVLAAVALGCYALISYAGLVALGATLTLPGLAGFVLAIGMAIDANVLVFERAREEYDESRQRGLRAALDRGYKNAWSAIADSNITTLLAAGLLFWLASGPVKGFGVTLGIGVIASMFSAMVITRVLTHFVIGRISPKVSGLGSVGRVRSWLTRRNPDLMSRGRLWLLISGGLVVAVAVGLFARGLNYGVEFTGGRIMEFATSRTVDAGAARQAVSEAGFPSAVVQMSNDAISVRTGQISADDAVRIEQALDKQVGDVTKQRDELIGPSMGEELRRNALIALGVALVAQLIYLAVRFRWTFGAAAVIALFVDTSAVVGAFAWLGKPIDGIFLAALLTIVGYSVNDKVIVFDRVRELWPANRKAPFHRVMNTAILQTVPRTVNTGGSTMFVVAALAVLGGDSLRDFAIALLIGIFVGTLSSTFLAGPAAIELERFSKQPPPQQTSKRSAPRAREGSGAVL
ncbi:protein translocase subunit SecD [Microtetraspora sp. NBRC 16547]|uniref:protein translocase subunit SecD n=1 Tax=Microtetraspora sp. NBRC 16547 TaxID=3030993 RepID=UPI0024A50682|nr:protein translocase subunit SecD [Microtetraspora sp. NBRC 16547]GLW99010.1 protein translocase subunit SecDF [Microtetraspora sp. NBRC 16547]